MLYIYGRQPRKISRWKRMIYSNMGYNKYMTEHVEPNKYFYVRRGIFQKRSKYCKTEDCFKISSYGIDKIERCLKHRLKSMTNIRRKHMLCKIRDIKFAEEENELFLSFSIYVSVFFKFAY